jgi:hypothetical protein
MAEALDRCRAALRRRLRPLLRALHRDIGYLLVGLTAVYALSGLAINHIDDWNPNFVTAERSHVLRTPLDAAPERAAAQVLQGLGVAGPPRAAYWASPGQLEIELDGRRLHVDVAAGRVFEESQEPRFFLRVANWLHYNRGKAAWTYIADAYALLLLLLAGSGLFMIKGRRGLLGRGAVLVAIGVAIPVLYLHLSGGPGGG